MPHVPPPPTADAILETLDPEQRQVATALTGPVCVLAGAGTGKTRAITSRIAYGVHSGVFVPQQVLAVTFTARAAGEMRTRLRDLGVVGAQARTFHAAALRQLRYFWPRHVGGELPNLIDHKAGLVAEAASRLRLPTNRETVRDLSAEIEWVAVTLTDPGDYAAAAAKAGREPPAGLDAATVGKLLSTYAQVKRARPVIDFEDVLVYLLALLAEHRQVADAVRGQYHHLVVDEYQDVSPLQQALLDQWLGGRDQLCVVGDPNQTIYTFAGASPTFLTTFPQRHPGATVVRLVRDYRSTPQVVELANTIIRRASGPGAARAAVELRAMRPPGPAAELREHPDEPAEAAWVAQRIAELVRGGLPASEVAVLFRTNGQSEAYEQALADAEVPYLVRGGERFFDRGEVREARLLLGGAARSAAEDDDDLSAAVRGVLSSRGWSETAPTGGGALRDRWESLTALVRLADDLAAARPGVHLREFVAELDERADAQHAPTVDGVTLASLHAAKGLEWDAVFVVGATDGMIPISYADTPEAVEEERRLLYVGVTRARERITITWSSARAPGGRGGRRPSRFLDGLHAGRRADEAGAREPGGRRRKGPAVCRVCGRSLATPAARKLGRCEDCPSSYDEGLFERLREWRSEQAKAASVPAYVVFTDATLVALAEARPTTERGLLAVSGVGRTKLERYGADVLALCAGDDVPAGEVDVRRAERQHDEVDGRRINEDAGALFPSESSGPPA